jgi:hypothetical protein
MTQTGSCPSGLDHEIGQVSSCLRAWKHWSIDLCPSGMIFAASVTCGDVWVPQNSWFSGIEPFNIQSIPSMGEALISSVWSSKIYISTVRFTVPPHPPTKDFSSLRTFPVFALKLCSTVSYLVSRRCPSRPLRRDLPLTTRHTTATESCIRPSSV